MTTASTTIVNPRTPSADWTLDKLGKFITATARKTAENIWHMGHALTIAHAKCDYGQWEQFCNEHVPFSKTTIWRMRKIAELPFDDVKDEKASVLYKRLESGKEKATTETEYTATVVEPPAPTDPTASEDINGQDTEDVGPKQTPDAPDVEAIVAQIIGETPHYLKALEDVVLELADDLANMFPERETSFPNRAEVVRVLVQLMTASKS